MYNKTLCRGFLVERLDYNAQEILETRYAVLADGTVFQSEERVRDNTFASKKWIAVSELPEHAEFIGNYPVPKVEV